MLKTERIKWGILGTSFISEVIANAINESTTSELIAIGSRSKATAKLFSEKFSVKYFYDDYPKLLENNNIDVIYIGLPNHMHKEWIERSAQMGKNILCEKPLVISREEGDAVVSLIQKANVHCMEALMYRYHPFTKKLKEIINSGIIGKVKLYNAAYTANIADIANPTAGGSIRNLGCYPISLVRYLANAEPIEITGSGRSNHKNGSDNQASVILKFPDSAIAVISTADDLEMFWQFEVYGTKGHLKVISNPWLPTCEHNKLHLFLNENSTHSEINVTAEKSLYTYQIDAMAARIRNENEDEGMSLLDSLSNTIVLETWRRQVLTVKQHESIDVAKLAI